MTARIANSTASVPVRFSLSNFPAKSSSTKLAWKGVAGSYFLKIDSILSSLPQCNRASLGDSTSGRSAGGILVETASAS
jgi:hypothetical protein